MAAHTRARESARQREREMYALWMPTPHQDELEAAAAVLGARSSCAMKSPGTSDTADPRAPMSRFLLIPGHAVSIGSCAGGLQIFRCLEAGRLTFYMTVPLLYQGASIGKGYHGFGAALRIYRSDWCFCILFLPLLSLFILYQLASFCAIYLILGMHSGFSHNARVQQGYCKSNPVSVYGMNSDRYG